MSVGTSDELLAGRYRVEKRLGSGGMAAVFLAHDERLDRKVALKRLHADSPEDVARRFTREAKVGASLNHPNVVSVYDTVTDDEGVLIVMEYVEGHTLRDEMAAGLMSPERTIEVLAGVSAALDHAHEHGVIHRDVKPANILVDDSRGTVKLADLGIATAAERTRITNSGTVLGTAAYIAPERLDGHAGGPAVDTYALAAVAFEALSGRKAFTGSTAMEIARRIATQEPPDLTEAVPGTPRRAAEVLRRTLAKDPSGRPASAGEFVRLLAGAFVEPVREQPPPKPARAAAAAVPAAAAAAATPAAAAPGPQRAQPAVASAPPAPTPQPAAPAPPRRPAHGAADRPAPYRSRRRPVRALAAAAIGLAAVAALVLAATLGGGSSSKSTSGRTASSGAKTRAAARKHGSSASTQAPAAVQPPAAGTGTGTASAGAGATPQDAITQFYQRGLRGDVNGAWAFGTDNVHSQVGGLQSFRSQEQSLRSISFPRLDVTSQSGDRATVAFQSIAEHTAVTDHCNGTMDTVRSGGGWKVDQVHVNCTHQPNGGAARPQAQFQPPGQAGKAKGPKGFKGGGGD